MTMSDTEALERAKRQAGGSSRLARLLGIRAQAISQWRRVPAERVIAVEAATGVLRHELRPDIYPPPAASSVRGRPGSPLQIAPGAPVDVGSGHFSRFKHLRRSHFATAEQIDEHVDALRDEWARR
jgi:DNA-binding transcriptional regulator YdaS (Cro superfamily)